MATYLAWNKSDAREIAGVLINRSYKISESILEKPNPPGEALRQASKAILKVGKDWPDGRGNNSTVPRRTFQNTQAALLRLGIDFWFDEFRQRRFVGGKVVQSFQGELNDTVCSHLRDMVNKKFGFDPGKEMTRDSVDQLCNSNVVDPVNDYLSGLEWDGQLRLETWLIDFAGAEDTPYVRAVSKIILIAAVRRVRKPGTKFDTIPVLEGEQGTGKSSLIEVMASKEFFSDQDILALDNKSQIEAQEGVWLYEIADLAGMKYADVNKVKSFASRSVDRGRPAYARFAEARPRRNVLIGTTNDDEYLKDETGNRRFWPIRTAEISLEGLAAVRDQLWAEAADLEANGESIVLPRKLWKSAEVEQKKRVAADGWEEFLSEISGEIINGREVLTTMWLLEAIINIPRGQIKIYHMRRLAKAMRTLGWKGPVTVTALSGNKAKGYWRPTDRNEDVIRHEI